MKNKTTTARWQSALLFAFFFLVIMAFWCMKPLRTAGVVKALGPDLYPFVKQGSLLLVPLVMVFYEAMIGLLDRKRMVMLFTGIFVAGCIFFRLSFAFFPSTASKIAFFYYVDIYSTVMLTTLFWTYVNSLYEADEAKKVYGLIGSGGLLGGICGALISGWANEILGANIILVAAALLAGVFPVLAYLEKLHPGGAKIFTAKKKQKQSAIASSTEGVRLVWKSSYLLSMVAMVALYEVVSSVIDYQFNASCTAMFPTEIAMAGYQGRVFFVGQLLSLGVMLFVTPFVFKHFGIKVGLLLLPVALATGSLAFALFPVLPLITATIGAETTLAYSIGQASKEILYLPLSALEKFKAKAFIDMFIYRFGKALGAVVVLVYLSLARPFGLKPSHLLVANALLVFAWIFAILKVSTRFERSTKSAAKPTKLAA